MINSTDRKTFKDRNRQKKRFNKQLLFTIIALAVFFLMSTFLAVPVKLESKSMQPTFSQNSCLFVSPATYGKTIQQWNIMPFLSGPKRGDIVLMVPPYYEGNSGFLEFINPMLRFISFQRLSFRSHPDQDWENPFIIKRVIAVPGDSVKIEDYTAYVKTKGNVFFLSEFEVSEDEYDIYIEELPEGWDPEYPLSGFYEEIILEDNQYFVLGDNRAFSSDSRYWGVVGKELIIGRVFLRYWPLGSGEKK